MTPEELRARLAADFLVAHATAQSERPDGLTASMLLGCSTAAVRTILGRPTGDGTDVYRGLRGMWTHDGLSDSLAVVDPGFTDGRKERFTWDPGGGLPVITGAYDFLLDGIPVEVKTRPKAECRWHADHGASPQHSAQVAAAAVAVGAQQAFVVYLPTDADQSEMAVCEVDVGHWARETIYWLNRVDQRDEYAALRGQGADADDALRQVLEGVPREPSVNWCRLFCGAYKECRGDYVAPADVEIVDPTIRSAAQEAEHWRQVRLDAAKREEAAKAMLEHAEGRVTIPGEAPLQVAHPKVEDKPGRRGHTKTVVSRRPG